MNAILSCVLVAVWTWIWILDISRQGTMAASLPASTQEPSASTLQLHGSTNQTWEEPTHLPSLNQTMIETWNVSNYNDISSLSLTSPSNARETTYRIPNTPITLHFTRFRRALHAASALAFLTAVLREVEHIILAHRGWGSRAFRGKYWTGTEVDRPGPHQTARYMNLCLSPLPPKPQGSVVMTYDMLRVVLQGLVDFFSEESGKGWREAFWWMGVETGVGREGDDGEEVFGSGWLVRQNADTAGNA